VEVLVVVRCRCGGFGCQPASDVGVLVVRCGGFGCQMWWFWLSDVVVLVVGVCVLVVADVGAASRSAAGPRAAADVWNFVVGET
jgi:hypothetical protein